MCRGWQEDQKKLTDTIADLTEQLKLKTSLNTLLVHQAEEHDANIEVLEEALRIVVGHMPMGALVRSKKGWKKNAEIIASAIEQSKAEVKPDEQP